MHAPPPTSTSHSHLPSFLPSFFALFSRIFYGAERYCSERQTTPTLQPPESWQGKRGEGERESDEGLRVRGICTILSAIAAAEAPLMCGVHSTEFQLTLSN